MQTELACSIEYVSPEPYGYIYLTTNLINGMKYIGQHSSSTFDKYYYGSGVLIKKALSEYGIENFKCEIIEWCDTFEYLNEREKYWIRYYNADLNENFYNKAMGGSNSKFCLRDINHPWYNKKHSEESLRKMSESKQGENNPMYGKHHTDETKEKIKNAQLGEKNHMYGKSKEAYWYNKHRDEETKKKISENRIKNHIASKENNPFYGKTHSEENKKKMSDASKNRTWINNGQVNKRVKNYELENYLIEGWIKGRLSYKKQEGVSNELS